MQFHAAVHVQGRCHNGLLLLRSRMRDAAFAIFRVAVIILNKQSLTADKGLSFSSFAARMSSNPFKNKLRYHGILYGAGDGVRTGDGGVL
jgi:hypothetical protein